MSDHYDASGRLLDEPDDEPTGRQPGPWRFNQDGRTVDAGPDGPLTTLRVCQMFGWGDRYEANARLIAAAPDLLNALAQMVVNCPLCSRDPAFSEGVNGEGLRCGHCHAARAVLDKATSRE